MTEPSLEVEITPRTANRVADAAALQSATRKRKEAANGQAKPKAAKIRKQIVDSVTELQEQQARRGIEGESSQQSQLQSQNILGETSLASKQERMDLGLLKNLRVLPRSAIQFRFEEIAENPSKHFFAGMAGYGDYSHKQDLEFYAGPPGLPKELQGLFTFKIDKKGIIGKTKRANDINNEGEEERRKRMRSETFEASEPVELGRDRQASLPSVAIGEVDMLDFGGPHAGNEMDFMGNDFDLDLGQSQQDISLDIGYTPRAMLDSSPSRLGTPDLRALDESLNIDFGKIDRANASVLNVFDSVSKNNNTKRDNQKIVSTPMKNSSGFLSVPGSMTTQSQDEDVDDTQTSGLSGNGKNEQGRTTGGWSRNTLKALKILEHEMQPPEEDKQLSFEKLSNKVVMPFYFRLID